MRYASLLGVVLLCAAAPAFGQVGRGQPLTGTQPAGGIRVGDGGTPLPRDRVFFNYDYYNGVFVRGGATIATPGDLRSGDFFGSPETVRPGSDTGGLFEIGIRRSLAGLERTFLDSPTSTGLRLPFSQAGDATSLTLSALIRNNTLRFNSPFGERVRGDLTQIQVLAGVEILPLAVSGNRAGVDVGGGVVVTPFVGGQIGVGMNILNDLRYEVPGVGLTARQDGALRVAPVAAVSAGLRISLDSIHPGLRGEIGYRFSYNGGIRSGGNWYPNGGGPIALDPFRGTSYSHDIFIGASLPFSMPANRVSGNQP